MAKTGKRKSGLAANEPDDLPLQESVPGYPLLIDNNHYQDAEHAEVHLRLFNRIPERRRLKYIDDPETPGNRLRPPALPGWRGAVRPLQFPPNQIETEAAVQWLDYTKRRLLNYLTVFGRADASDEVHDAWLLAAHLRSSGRHLELAWDSTKHYPMEEGAVILADALLRLVALQAAAIPQDKVVERAVLTPQLGSSVLILDDRDLDILKALDEQPGIAIKVASLIARLVHRKANLSERTVRDRLARLEPAGYVNRKGKRGGFTVSDKGRKLIAG